MVVGAVDLEEEEVVAEEVDREAADVKLINNLQLQVYQKKISQMNRKKFLIKHFNFYNNIIINDNFPKIKDCLELIIFAIFHSLFPYENLFSIAKDSGIKKTKVRH